MSWLRGTDGAIASSPEEERPTRCCCSWCCCCYCPDLGPLLDGEICCCCFARLPSACYLRGVCVWGGASKGITEVQGRCCSRTGDEGGPRERSYKNLPPRQKRAARAKTSGNTLRKHRRVKGGNPWLAGVGGERDCGGL